MHRQTSSLLLCSLKPLPALLAAVGPASPFLSAFPSGSHTFLLWFCKQLQLGKANCGKFKAFVRFPPAGNQLMEPRKLCHVKTSFLSCCSQLLSNGKAMFLCSSGSTRVRKDCLSSLCYDMVLSVYHLSSCTGKLL